MSTTSAPMTLKEKWKERIKKVLPWIGFPIFYVVCLFLFAVWTFPFDRLRERIVTSFNSQQRATNGTQELSIDEMSGYLVSGVKMKGIKLATASSEPGKPPSELKVDEAKMRVSILPLLIGNKDISFDLSAFGGRAYGSFDNHGKDRDVDVTLEEIDMGQVEPLVALLGVPIEGRLSGNVKLAMPEGKASKGSGSVSLTAHDVAVGDGKAKLKGALALPRLTVGDLTLTAEARDGQLKVTKLAAGGKDLELQGEGRIQMRELAPDSVCDMSIRFKVNDAYRNKNDITKSLFGAPGSNAPALIELSDPRVKQSKRPDGFFAWSVRGPLGNPKFDPAGGGAGGSAVPGLQFPGGGVPSLPGVGNMTPQAPKQ